MTLEELVQRVEELEKNIKRLEDDFRQYRIQNYDKVKNRDSSS